MLNKEGKINMNRLSYILLTLIFCIFVSIGCITGDIAIGCLLMLGMLFSVIIGVLEWEVKQ